MLCKRTIKQMATLKSGLVEKFPQAMQQSLDFQAKVFRKMFLDRPLLEKRKIIVPIKRTRSIEDTLAVLRENKEAPGVVLKREDREDLDFVLDQRQLYTMRHFRDPKTQSFYLQDEEKELIRVYQDVIFEHPIHRYIVWSRFNRYEEGKPNVMDIPVVVESNNRNRYINRGNQDMIQKMNKIKVVSYNSDYPSKFVIDPANLAPGKPYKVGDLQGIH